MNQRWIFKFNALSKRFLRHVNPKMAGLSRYQAVFLGGGLLSMVGLWVLHEPDNRNSSRVFKQDSHLDFKNASILGNPSRILLQEEESNLSKTQRTVLESQSLLKKEVDSLKSELQQLRASGNSVPNPSASPTAHQDGAVFGPQPLPSPGMSLEAGHTAPGEEFNHTQISDQVSTHAAAPLPVSRHNAGRSVGNRMGLNELGPLPKEKKPGSTMISFPVKGNGKAYLKKPSIVLPSGSYVKAVLLTGVEAPEGKTYPVLMQLDFAYVIPNDKRLDLSGCFMIAKAQGDLSTERVQMQATKLSCISKKTGMFEREVNGFVADDADNSFAVIGRVNSKQDRVAATAFLASIVSGIGKAIQQAQTTQQTTPLGGAQAVITGDQAKYIGAGGASEAASQVTQWYLKQAQNLLPTINVGSGQEVWIVMQDQVDLPKDYFNQNSSGGISNASIYSYFTRIDE